MKTEKVTRSGGRRRVSRFVHRYAYGVMALALVGSVLLWQAWERPRRVAGPTYFYLKPVPLESKLVKLRNEGKTLREVVEDLGKQCGVGVEFEEKGLADLGYDLTAPVVLEKVPAGQVTLQAALLQLQGVATDWIEFEIEPEGIVFGARGILLAEKRGKRVVYPMMDLLTVRTPLERPADASGDVSNLKFVIKANVQPENWTENGGTIGSMKFENDCLIVVATPKMHFMIRQIIEGMRARR